MYACMGQYMYINTSIHICIFIFIHKCIHVLYLYIHAYGALTDGALTDGALTDGALADGALTDGVLTDGALTAFCHWIPCN